MRDRGSFDVHRTRRAVHEGIALLRDAHLDDFGEGLHVPVSESLFEKFVDRCNGRDVVVVGSVGLPVVISRHLKADAALELHRTQLGTSPGRGTTATTARTNSSDESCRVKKLRSDLHSRLEPGLAH
ncbi:unannotated protein [freshwater metagenome]|uniref:Unannotated protein n=1 Tax=freshwater metagenome TaxID=449393 RepID=A0A6J7C602_9ZZZZ